MKRAEKKVLLTLPKSKIVFKIKSMNKHTAYGTSPRLMAIMSHRGYYSRAYMVNTPRETPCPNLGFSDRKCHKGTILTLHQDLAFIIWEKWRERNILFKKFATSIWYIINIQFFQCTWCKHLFTKKSNKMM